MRPITNHKDMKKQFKLIEFPNVDDHRIYTFSHHLQNIQNTLQTLILSIIDKNKQVKITFGVVVAILMRIQECVTSIQLLAIKGRCAGSTGCLSPGGNFTCWVY